MLKLSALLTVGLRGAGCEVTTEPWGGRGAESSLVTRVGERFIDVVRVRRAVRAYGPDVLLVQTAHDWMCVTRDLALALLTRKDRRCIILEFHGSQTDRLNRPGDPLFKLATFLLLRLLDAVFVLSSEEARSLQLFVPGGRFYCVTNPFEPSPDERELAPASLEPRDPKVLFVARLLREKGILDTLEAIVLLNQRGRRCELLVAGDGPMAAELNDRVAEAGIGDQVRLSGHLSSQALLEEYRSSDVFVLPTYHPEGFPTSIAEAMSAGLPIITTKTRGAADHLIEGTNALFVPARDPAALAEAILRLLDDDELRRRMGQENARKVREFAPDRVVGDYVRAMNELLASASERGGARDWPLLAGDEGHAAERANGAELNGAQNGGWQHLASSRAGRDAFLAAARAGFELAEQLGWRSYDPFDFLLSPYLGWIRPRSPFAARVAVQVGKRSGRLLRRSLRIGQHEEAKTLSDFLRAAVLLASVGEEWAHTHVAELTARLQACSTPTPSGRGWGLAFPYASRFVSVPAGAPNIYTTTGACEALLDAHALTGDPGALESALAGAGFLLDDLGAFELDGHVWLRYWQGLDTPTINVQASAAALLHRMSEFLADVRLRSRADRAVATVVAHQSADGSWAYSADGRASFIDGFHTGFTLQGLADYAARGGDEAVSAREALSRGLAYFTAHLLEADGSPREFADGRRSADGQTVAQAIQTLVVCGAGSELSVATGIWQRELSRRLLPKSGPAYPALRWTVGPAVLATAHLVRASS